MRYTIEKSVVRVVGHIWQPGVGKCATDLVLDRFSTQGLLDAAKVETVDALSREHVAAWLRTHAGDFSKVLDFEADFSYQGHDFLSPWASEDSECAYSDCMFPPEE